MSSTSVTDEAAGMESLPVLMEGPAREGPVWTESSSSLMENPPRTEIPVGAGSRQQSFFYGSIGRNGFGIWIELFDARICGKKKVTLDDGLIMMQEVSRFLKFQEVSRASA